MKRFFGMMPNDEVEVEKHYKDQYNMSITIQAGPHGWTVIWADGGTNYDDADATTQQNFESAYACVKELGFELTERVNGGARVGQDEGEL